LPEEGKTTVQAEAEKLSAILFNPSHAEESLEKLKEGNIATLEKVRRNKAMSTLSYLL
jgi:hypothetical protein